MILWAWRAYPKGDAVRLGAALVGIFTLTEALLGAALVLFGWVALNQSVQRAVSVAAHLVNTFLLLGALAFTARAASGGGKVTVRGQGWAAWGLGLGLLAMLALGTSGAVTALGDTLFPSGSLAQGVQQDFAPTAHFLIRLRIFHPLIAIAVTAYLLAMGNLVLRARPGAGSRRLLSGLTAVLVVQLVAGAVNVALLAPIWMQLLHLFFADLTWITIVLLAASFLAAGPGTVRQGAEDAQEARRNALSAS